MTDAPENTGQKRKPVPPMEHRFQLGNPGRPKGARNKLGEAFVQDVLANWEKNGAASIEVMRVNDPGAYVRVVASILPKELNLRVNDFDDFTDDQLARELASIAAQLANAGLGIDARDQAALGFDAGEGVTSQIH